MLDKAPNEPIWDAHLTKPSVHALCVNRQTEFLIENAGLTATIPIEAEDYSDWFWQIDDIESEPALPKCNPAVSITDHLEEYGDGNDAYMNGCANSDISPEEGQEAIAGAVDDILGMKKLTNPSPPSLTRENTRIESNTQHCGVCMNLHALHGLSQNKKESTHLMQWLQLK